MGNYKFRSETNGGSVKECVTLALSLGLVWELVLGVRGGRGRNVCVWIFIKGLGTSVRSAFSYTAHIFWYTHLVYSMFKL